MFRWNIVRDRRLSKNVLGPFLEALLSFAPVGKEFDGKTVEVTIESWWLGFKSTRMTFVVDGGRLTPQKLSEPAEWSYRLSTKYLVDQLEGERTERLCVFRLDYKESDYSKAYQMIHSLIHWSRDYIDAHEWMKESDKATPEQMSEFLMDRDIAFDSVEVDTPKPSNDIEYCFEKTKQYVDAVY